MVDPGVAGAATLGITQGVSAFQFFLPRLSDVRKGSMNDPELVGDVRMGEVAAITLCVGIGAIVSSLTASSVPVLVSIVVSTILVCLYEATLRGDRPFEPKGEY